jgi:hypothetical protein
VELIPFQRRLSNKRGDREDAFAVTLPVVGLYIAKVLGETAPTVRGRPGSSGTAAQSCAAWRNLRSSSKCRSTCTLVPAVVLNERVAGIDMLVAT